MTDSSIQNILQVDTTGIIMADTDYNCGPAALATVLENYFGINITQDQLAILAGTDENGTTMYGLVQAAEDEGLIAEGLKLAVNQLEPGNIVFLTMNGEGHYSVITKITDTMVYLADSNLGNINMTLANFTADYNGDALVITNDTSDPQLNNSTILTTEEMQNIKGTFERKLNEKKMGPFTTETSIDYEYVTKTHYIAKALNINVKITSGSSTDSYVVLCVLYLYHGTKTIYAAGSCAYLFGANYPIINRWTASHTFEFKTSLLSKYSVFVYSWIIRWWDIKDESFSTTTPALDYGPALAYLHSHFKGLILL